MDNTVLVNYIRVYTCINKRARVFICIYARIDIRNLEIRGDSLPSPEGEGGQTQLGLGFRLRGAERTDRLTANDVREGTGEYVTRGITACEGKIKDDIPCVGNLLYIDY